MLASVCNMLSLKPFLLGCWTVICCLYILHSLYASKCLQHAVIETFPFRAVGQSLVVAHSALTLLASVCNKLSSKPFHLGMGDGRLSAHCTLSVYWQVFTTEQYFLNGVATVQSSISAKLEHLFYRRSPVQLAHVSTGCENCT